MGTKPLPAGETSPRCLSLVGHLLQARVGQDLRQRVRHAPQVARGLGTMEGNAISPTSSPAAYVEKDGVGPTAASCIWPKCGNTSSMVPFIPGATDHQLLPLLCHPCLSVGHANQAQRLSSRRTSLPSTAPPQRPCSATPETKASPLNKFGTLSLERGLTWKVSNAFPHVFDNSVHTWYK